MGAFLRKVPVEGLARGVLCGASGSWWAGGFLGFLWVLVRGPRGPLVP